MSCSLNRFKAGGVSTSIAMLTADDLWVDGVGAALG